MLVWSEHDLLPAVPFDIKVAHASPSPHHRQRLAAPLAPTREGGGMIGGRGGVTPAWFWVAISLLLATSAYFATQVEVRRGVEGATTASAEVR
jgi:hypothetical protein